MCEAAYSRRTIINQFIQIPSSSSLPYTFSTFWRGAEILRHACGTCSKLPSECRRGSRSALEARYPNCRVQSVEKVVCPTGISLSIQNHLE